MRFDLRSDASPVIGAGHVMRTLTVAAALASRGHDVRLHADLGGIAWLGEAASEAGVPVEAVAAGSLGEGVGSGAHAVVVDSYEIDAGAISELDARVPVLAIVDGTHREIRATRYLDHNLGAELAEWDPAVLPRLLAGSRYALVRDAVLRARRADAAQITRDRPSVVVVPGGTDASGSAAALVAGLRDVAADAEVTVIASGAPAAPGIRVVAPGADLAALLGSADAIVTGAGSSAWEVCALGVPAVFIALAANQRPSLERIAHAGLGPVIDAVGDPGALEGAGAAVARLLGDAALRRDLSARLRSTVDGLGASRVADALEAMR